MGLDHSCSNCNSSENEGGILDLDCCQNCQWKDDVVSYCRQRPTFPSDEYYNKFSTCSLEFIENEFIPAFTVGQIANQVNSCN